MSPTNRTARAKKVKIVEEEEREDNDIASLTTTNLPSYLNEFTTLPQVLSFPELKYDARRNAADAAKLLPSYAIGYRQRVDKNLADRSSLPRETYEKEIGEMIRLLRSGLISESTIAATLHHQSNCRCYGSGPRYCIADCWIGAALAERMYN